MLVKVYIIYFLIKKIPHTRDKESLDRFFIYRCISIKVAVNGDYSVLMSLWEQQLESTKYPHTIISRVAGGSRGRVCYERGLPHLVFNERNIISTQVQY